MILSPWTHFAQRFGHLETISPPLDEMVRPGVKHYVPWVPDWLDLNVMVPLIATVIVVAVGILVVCVALTRRGGDDNRNGPKDVYCRFTGLRQLTKMRSPTKRRMGPRFWFPKFEVFVNHYCDLLFL